MPWKKRSYDTNRGGFVINITQEQLTGAPEWGDNWYEDRDYRRRNYDYCGVSRYWL